MGIGRYNDNYHKENTLTASEHAKIYHAKRQARLQAQKNQSKTKTVYKFSNGKFIKAKTGKDT